MLWPGGVSITSINRETDLDEIIDEVKRRKEQGMPQLGKSSASHGILNTYFQLRRAISRPSLEDFSLETGYELTSW